MSEIKVKFRKSPSGNPFNLGYFVGDIATVEEKQAQELIDAGYAFECGKEETNLPLNFPYREKFAQLDAITVKDVVDLGDLNELEGFNEVMSSKVYGYLLAEGVIKESDLPEEDACKLPEDFPYRKELSDSGVNTVEEVLAIEDLTTIKGIGESKAKEVTGFLSQETNIT